MSWFLYGDLKKRNNRLGVWLRVDSIGNQEITKAIKKTGNRRLTERIDRIVVKEFAEGEKDNVHLEIWCASTIDRIRGKFRYNVFYIMMKENPDWCCEGDLGKGYRE